MQILYISFPIESVSNQPFISTGITVEFLLTLTLTVFCVKLIQNTRLPCIFPLPKPIEHTLSQLLKNVVV